MVVQPMDPETVMVVHPVSGHRKVVVVGNPMPVPMGKAAAPCEPTLAPEH